MQYSAADHSEIAFATLSHQPDHQPQCLGL